MRKRFGVAALFAVVAGLMMAQSVYENEYFKAVFPDMEPEHFTHTSKDISNEIVYSNDSLMLKAMVFDVSLCPNHNAMLGRQVEFALSDEEPAETIIGGKRMLRFKSASSDDSAGSYGSLYVLSNGEKTLLLTESGSDKPIEWWADHIDIKIAGKSSRWLLDRTNDFVRRMNSIGDGGIMRINVVPEDKSLIIGLIGADTSESGLTEEYANELVYKMINTFSIFEEYADLGYAFTVRVIDGEKLLQDHVTVTHDEYSQLTKEMFERRPYAEDGDNDCNIEVYEIELVGDNVGIAFYDGACALYDIDGDKPLTDFAYLELELVNEGDSEFGYEYVFRCVRLEGSEGEVTIIKGLDYTIAITD